MSSAPFFICWANLCRIDAPRFCYLVLLNIDDPADARNGRNRERQEEPRAAVPKKRYTGRQRCARMIYERDLNP